MWLFKFFAFFETGSHYVDQAASNSRDPSVSAGFKVYGTTPVFMFLLKGPLLLFFYFYGFGFSSAG